MRIVVSSGDEALAAARSQWDDLSRRSASGYFQSWAWVMAWHQVLEPAAPVVLVTSLGDDGRWEGLLALARLRRRLHRRVPRPVRYLGLAGSGPGAGDHLGPLVTSPHLIRPLVREAVGQADGGPVYFESVAATAVGPMRTALRAREVRTVVCPAVDLRPLDQAEQAWDPKVRKNLRRRDRMLAEEGITGRWVGPAEAMADELGTLQRVHLSRWQAQGQAGLFADERLAFLRRLAELASPPDGPWLYLLERADGTVVSALLGFRHGCTFSAYKTGWDPACGRLGLGLAMHSAAMRRACADGLDTYDFLRSQGGHKYSLGATDRRDVNLLRPDNLGGLLLGLREEVPARWAARTAATAATGATGARGG